MGITCSRLRFPSPALILSCLALFAALGGGAYAATRTGSGSIRFTNATLRNGWTDYREGSGPAGYAKDSLGVVHLRGGISSGTDETAAFVLPKDLRPGYVLQLPVYTAGGNEGSVDITPGGAVIPSGSDVTAFTSLDGISFVAGE